MVNSCSTDLLPIGIELYLSVGIEYQLECCGPIVAGIRSEICIHRIELQRTKPAPVGIELVLLMKTRYRYCLMSTELVTTGVG